MNDQEKTQHYCELADACLREKRYEEAITLFGMLVAMCPSEESFLLSLAWAYRDSGQMEQSLECFERLLEKELAREVFTGFAFDELVRIYKAEKRYGCLVEVCERAAAAQPYDTGILGELGDACLRADRAADAIEIFRKIVEMEPDSPMHLCRLGNAYIAAGTFDLAEEAYGRAIAIAPPEAAIFYSRLADAYVRAGNAEGAERALRKCLTCASDEPLNHLRLGDILIEMGKPDEAVDTYEAVIGRDLPSAGVYYNRLGNALAKAGYHTHAVEAFHKAIAAEPDNPFYYLRLADSCSILGLNDMAAEALSKAGSLKR